MLQLLFRKWWVVLLQGILLIILSIYVFQNPVEVLAGISFWCGLFVLLLPAYRDALPGWLLINQKKKGCRFFGVS